MSGTNARSYNQGLCSRRPCKTKTGECILSDQCCFEIGETSNVDFTCSDSISSHQGHVIVTCYCQPCSQLHAEVSGNVVSSRRNEPVVLATVLVGGEVVTFTNQEGAFSFETLTPTNELKLIFQETKHRELEKTITVHPSLIHKLEIVLEYIEVVEYRPKMETGFDTTLASNVTIETYGVNGFLHFPPNAFTYTDSDDLYHGSGKVLHSIYCTDKWPSFSTPALNNLIYVDSKGAEFSIQSFMIGTLSVVGEEGDYLKLQIGSPIIVTTSLRIESNINSAQLNWMHLFSYSQKRQRWLDHGKMAMIYDASTEMRPGNRGSYYWVTLQGKLRDLDPLWVVGYPLRLSCWVKTQVFQSSGLQEEMVGVEMQLRQSDDLVGRGSFYQHSTPTLLGVGACLKSICNLGGVLRPTPHEDTVKYEAVTPSIINGIIMGNKDEIMIYTVEKQNIGINGKHPFYPSEEACMQFSGSRSGHFRFVTKARNRYLTHPGILLTRPTVEQNEDEDDERLIEGFCYLKVAILDCAEYSDIKAVSYGNRGNVRSVAFEIASTLGGMATTKNTCTGDGMNQLKASCVDFTCGTSVHVSAQSRMERRHTKSCRYWSSTSSIPWTIPPSHNLTSFNFIDEGVGYNHGHGIYYALTKEVALMKCYSGSHDEPSNIMDPYRGAAVTFTCLS